MKGYKIPFREVPYEHNLADAPRWSEPELVKIKKEINSLLSNNAIEECMDSEGQFVSPYFLVQKPNGSNRFIINLKNLNKFIDPPHFKMEDIRAAKNLVVQKAFMCTIDLKDAFFLIPIHKDYRKFLRFRLQKKLYQFTCLPFGLCTSPYVYTKVMKPVMNTLRSQGILSIIYIDDILITNKSYTRCTNHVRKTINLLEHLGLLINYNKSSLIPSRRCKYLGFYLNSKDFNLELTNTKKQQIVNMTNSFQEGKAYKIRDFAKLLGVLTAACPAVAYSPTFCKRLERQKFLALMLNDNDYEGKIFIKHTMTEDLLWWQKNALIGKNPIRTHEFVMEISSDASLTGWGAFCNGVSTHGLWTEKEKRFSINYLELLAAFFAIKCFASQLSNSEILLRIDNTSAISYINKAGGIQFPHLSELSRNIWKWCEERKLWIFASYIPSGKNVEADTASRLLNIDTEWELNNTNFEIINKKFGPFTIDLFASRLNKKCNRFCSRFPHPDATVVDAFTMSWKGEKFYAFPPFALILRILRKIIINKAEGVLVVPLWPSQPWYPLFNSLLKSPPLIFETDDNTLLSPHRQEIHPLASKLSLMAGNLYGGLFETKASTRTQ